MISAFAMILATGMVIGDGPEKETGEMEATTRLDMSGRWEGTFLNAGGIKWKAVIENGTERMYDQGKLVAGHDWKVVDEGGGKLRLNGCPGKPGWGIYKVEGDCVTICFCDMPNPRPTEFRVTKTQALFILHRVKPRK
jgi:hypothetical protein